MANRVIELVREIMAEQNKPWDEDKETDEQHLGRLALENEWIGGLCYKGNSVSWSHSKSVNYGKELQRAWDELRKLGAHCDGNTTVAQAIVKLKPASGDQSTEFAARWLPTKAQIAEALDRVQLFSRINDMVDPPRIEICRYGADDEDEIVVLSRHDTHLKEHDLLRNAVRDARADAILALFARGER